MNHVGNRDSFPEIKRSAIVRVYSPTSTTDVRTTNGGCALKRQSDLRPSNLRYTEVEGGSRPPTTGPGPYLVTRVGLTQGVRSEVVSKSVSVPTPVDTLYNRTLLPHSSPRPYTDPFSPPVPETSRPRSCPSPDPWTTAKGFRESLPSTTSTPTTFGWNRLFRAIDLGGPVRHLHTLCLSTSTDTW